MVNDVVSGKQDEIIGGLKNAMDRGESLDMARFSFFNAGYSPQMVDMAARTLLSGSPLVQQQAPLGSIPVRGAPVNIPSAGVNLYAQRPPVVMPVTQRRGIFGSGVPYWVVILMILLALGIVVGAGVMGLYWDSLFV